MPPEPAQRKRAATKTVKKTAYHILRRNGNPTGLELVGENVEAHNANAAVRAHVEGRAGDPAQKIDGVYIAVPARSWKAVPVQVETQTIIKLLA